jgi:hypothetical protein
VKRDHISRSEGSWLWRFVRDLAGCLPDIQSHLLRLVVAGRRGRRYGAQARLLVGVGGEVDRVRLGRGFLRKNRSKLLPISMQRVS